MRRLLDINNPIMRFLTNVFDLLALSVMWVVFSLPVITMGAASAVLYVACVSGRVSGFMTSPVSGSTILQRTWGKA